jgi:hypothetical protein
MIECPSCKISFSPQFRVCPRCGTYEAKLEDRIEYLEHIAEEALDQNALLRDVESMLIIEGLAADQAREIVSRNGKKVTRVARFYGLKRLAFGLGVLLLSVFVLADKSSSPRSRIRAIFAALTGALFLVWGMYSLLAGRR